MLLAPRRYLHSVEGVTEPARGLGKTEWVISRALCRFGRFDLANIPKSQRHRAIHLQIRQWSSFSSTGFCVVLGNDVASIWTWDKDKVDQAVNTAKLNSQRTPIIPESLLHHPEVNAHRLVECMDGVEGQIWQDGQLTHARWWPVAPDLVSWNAFLRDGGQAAADSVPDSLRTIFSSTPWAQVNLLNDGAAGRYEGISVLIAFSLLAAMSAWFLVQSIQISRTLKKEKDHLIALEQRARPIQEARQQALDLRERIEFLRGLDPYPAQTILQAEVGKRLPKDGTFIKDWDFHAGKLRLTLASPNKLQASTFVKAYQEAGWFKDVQAPSGSDPNLLIIEMSVLRLAEINRQPIESKPSIPPPSAATPKAS